MDRFLPFRLLCLLALACSSSALAPPQAPQRYARNHILHATGQPDQASFLASHFGPALRRRLGHAPCKGLLCVALSPHTPPDALAPPAAAAESPPPAAAPPAAIGVFEWLSTVPFGKAAERQARQLSLGTSLLLREAADRFMRARAEVEAAAEAREPAERDAAASRALGLAAASAESGRTPVDRRKPTSGQ